MNETIFQFRYRFGRQFAKKTTIITHSCIDASNRLVIFCLQKAGYRPQGCVGIVILSIVYVFIAPTSVVRIGCNLSTHLCKSGDFFRFSVLIIHFDLIF